MAFGFDPSIILSGKFADPLDTARSMSDLIRQKQVIGAHDRAEQKGRTLADLLRGQSGQFTDPLAQKLAEFGMPEQAMEWEAKVQARRQTQQVRPGGAMLLPGEGGYYSFDPRNPTAAAQPIRGPDGQQVKRPKAAPRPVDPLKRKRDELQVQKMERDLSPEVLGAAAAKTEDAFRQEVAKDARLAKYGKSAAELANLRALAKVDSGAGDLAIVFAFMKALDPDSAVREAEYDNAAATGAPTQRMMALVSKWWTGEKLTPKQRAEFIRAAEQSQVGHKAAADKTLGTLRYVAKKRGFDFRAVGLEDTVRVTNGKETREIDASDLEDAQRDGYRVVR